MDGRKRVGREGGGGAWDGGWNGEVRWRVGGRTEEDFGVMKVEVGRATRVEELKRGSLLCKFLCCLYHCISQFNSLV